MTKKECDKRAKKIRLLLLDVDGVMTDGRLGFDGAGQEFKFFYARDGIGIRLLQRAGLRVGLLSGRKARVVERRARDLGIDLVLQKVRDKGPALRKILEAEELSPDQVCFVGDDLVDLPVFLQVGLAVAVGDAVPEVKAGAHLTTRKRGGYGAVREICEFILKAQGKWKEGVRDILSGSGG